MSEAWKKKEAFLDFRNNIPEEGVCPVMGEWDYCFDCIHGVAMAVTRKKDLRVKYAFIDSLFAYMESEGIPITGGHVFDVLMSHFGPLIGRE